MDKQRCIAAAAETPEAVGKTLTELAAAAGEGAASGILLTGGVCAASVCTGVGKASLSFCGVQPNMQSASIISANAGASFFITLLP